MWYLQRLSEALWSRCSLNGIVTDGIVLLRSHQKLYIPKFPKHEKEVRRMSKKRIMSWILIVFFVAGVLFSYGYIARNVEHDCTGQECPICMHLQQAAQFLSNIKTMSTTPVFLAFLSVFTLGVVLVYAHEYCTDTLVSLKVELLN